MGSHGNNGPALHVERSEVRRELDSLELAVSQMKAEISRLQNGIGTLGELIGGTMTGAFFPVAFILGPPPLKPANLCFIAHENEVAVQAIQEAGQKRAVLLAHSVKSDQEVELLNEYTRRISQRKECFR